MRLKFAAVLLSLSALGLVASSRFALADTLTLTGVGGAQSDGDYVYPYLFTVNNGSSTATNISLSCLSFDRDVTIGESWTAAEYSIPMGSGTLDGESYADYRADVWLFNQYSNSSYTATEVQFAIWSIMDPTGVQGKSGFDATAQSLASQAKTAATTEPLSYYAGDVLYIPESWPSNDGQPQIFLTNVNPLPTPEPNSLLLFGTGLLGIAGVIRQRRPQLSAVTFQK